MNNQVADRFCGNCSHFGTRDEWCDHTCPAGHAACKNWDERIEPIVFGHTALNELESRRQFIEEHLQELLVSNKKAYEKGWMVCSLYNMCEAACQYMPGMKNEWIRLRDTLADTLKTKWKLDIKGA